MDRTRELTKILVVEDSQPFREYITELVQILGFKAHAVRQKSNFLTDLSIHKPDLILLGSCSNPGRIKAIAKVVELESNTLPIIYIADRSDRDEMEINGLSYEGYVCCLPPDFSPNDLKAAIHQRISTTRSNSCEKLDEILVGESSAIVKIKKHILRLSKSDVTVLITGESGTGKELVAKAIHDFSPRARKPFIKVNSAALPGNLIESELFGYEKGAFTGAWRNKPGKFILAHSGTLLLDEIGELSLHVQPKLLQVLEDDEIVALGSTGNAKIDVRVLASTNSDLGREVKKGRFRADLYYRLNVVAIHLPSLRQRTEDIALLCRHFLRKHSGAKGMHGNGEIEIKDSLIEQMCRYSWPGNVRELENLLRSYIVFGHEESFLAKLRTQSKEPSGNTVPTPASPPGEVYSSYRLSNLSLKKVTEEATRKAETAVILEALAYTRWNRRKTAEVLKISYKALLNKITKYAIEEKHQQLVGRQSPGGSGKPATGSG